MDGPLEGSSDTTAFTYDAITGDLLTVTRPLTGTTLYSEYDALGRVGRVTEPDGNSKTYTYDAAGRVGTVTDEGDGGTITYDYDASANLAGLTDEDGVSFDYLYDTAYERLTRVTDPSGNYLAYTYDQWGNPASVGIHRADNTAVHMETYDYTGGDRPGKLWRAFNPDGSYREYTYGGRDVIASVTAPSDTLPGPVTSYDYDLLSRLKRITRPGAASTLFEYDEHDNLTSVTDAEGNKTTYTHDDMGRLLSESSPDAGTVRYGYDDQGAVVVKEDAAGNCVTHTYDALSRPTAVRFTDPSRDITFTYDQGTNGAGRLTEIRDGSGTLAYEYDGRGRMIRKTKTVDGETHVTGYTYSPGGRLIGMTYPGGLTVNYELDPATGRPERVTAEFNGENLGVADGMTHLPFGPLETMTLGNGLRVVKAFDQLYRVTSVATGQVMDLAYLYYANGNVEAVQDRLSPSESLSFTYDALYHLEEANGAFGAVALTYDKVGNRLTRDHGGALETYAYGPVNNRLEQVSGNENRTLSHDEKGNATSITHLAETPSAAYAFKNHTYVYDGMNRRTKKIGENGTTHYSYDPSGKLLAEWVAGGDEITQSIYLEETPIAMVVTPVGSGTPRIYYYHLDHLGTPLKMSDETGTLVWEARYNPFGEATVILETVENNLRFPGQYFDKETGLHYNLNRYYDPGIGRYLTPDPIGLKGGANLYAYTQNNPVNRIDPYGLDWKDVSVMINDVNQRYGMKKPASVLYSPKLNPQDIFGRADRWSNQIILPINEFDRKLSRDDFGRLYQTIYHEMRHLDAPQYQESIDFWYELFTGDTGPFHKQIFIDEFYVWPSDSLFEKASPCGSVR